MVDYDQLEKGPWRFENDEGALLFSQLSALSDWSGILPSALGICRPEDDAPLIVAYHRNKSFMAQYEAQVRRKEMERDRAIRNNKNAKYGGIKVS